MDREERVIKLLQDQEDLEQTKRQNLLDFQQKFRDYSRLGWYNAIAIFLALGLGVFLGVNEVADGIVCYKSNPLCINLRIKGAKKVI